METFITKASGEKESFNETKFRSSILRAGASAGLADEVTRAVIGRMKSGVSTEKIYNSAREHLAKKKSVVAVKYFLKRSIMKLGPAGYLFEKYFARILEEYGYLTEVGQIVKGHCINQEVDVIARKNKKHFMIECKFHNRPGIRSNSQVAMYTYARFLDVEREWKKIKNHDTIFHQAWLVTNTKCTSEAVKFARCMDIKIIAWRYPKRGGLERLIENKKLYPITILPSLPSKAIEKFSSIGVILAKDLLKHTSSKLVQLIPVSEKDIKKLQREAEELCLY